MNIDLKKSKNYFYLFLLLGFSGNPFFTSREEGNVSKILVTIVTVVLVVIYYRKLKIPESKHLYIFLGFFSMIFSMQYLILGFVSISGVFGFMLKIILGYIIIAIIGADFKNVYFKTIYFISLVSLFGFIWTQIGMDIPALYVKDGGKSIIKSVIIYTQRIGYNAERNAGMFWEPGAFACYILLGFSFFIGRIRELIKNHRNKVLVIITALITTFSTTGYLVFFIIVLYTLVLEYEKSKLFITIPLIIITLIIGYQLYSKTDFLQDKIEGQYETAKNLDGEFNPGRFGALLFDLHYIKKHPLFGNGLHEKTRYADHPKLIGEKLGHGNGFSNFLATMGFLSLLLYVYYFLRYNQNNKVMFLVIFILLLQGEPLLNFAMFSTIPFIFLFNANNRRTSDMPQQT